MQINRLIEMVYLLLGRESMTAAELAARFEVSPRTVYRDIDILSGAGIPVYSVKGKGGGISLLPNFVLNKALLSDDEQTEILTALQTLSVSGAAEADRLLPRLRSLFQKEDSGWIEVDFSRWGSGPEEKQKFGLLKTAILGRRIIRFSYHGMSGEVTARAVEPVKLHYKDGAWYLQAFCRVRNAYRSFKITRMRELTLTDEPFSPREEAPPPLDPIVWNNGGPKVRLTLWFAPSCAYRLFDMFFPREMQKNEDGSFIVSFETRPDEWLYGFLLSLGEDVRVLHPEHVGRQLGEKARSIWRMYESGSGK